MHLHATEMCQAGEFSTEGDGYEPCLPCPDGGWQNKTRASFCYACDYDQKTGRKGATNGSECGTSFHATLIYKRTIGMNFVHYSCIFY